MRRFVLAVALAVFMAPLMSAVTITVDSGWLLFSFGSIGSVSNFDYTSVGPVSIRLVDCCIIGDEFSMSIDAAGGILSSPTDPLLDGVQSGAFDGDTSWANADLSKLGVGGLAGFHTLDVTVTRNALGQPNGGGAFIRVDTFQFEEVPEPSTFALFGSAALGLAMLRRRAILRQK